MEKNRMFLWTNTWNWEGFMKGLRRIAVLLCCLLVLGFTGCSRLEAHKDKETKVKQELITVEEAQIAVEEFCRQPNIGVQASYCEDLNIKVDKTVYYYFDVIYGLLMGDSPDSDDMIDRVFVSSKDKSLYEVIEDDDGTLSLGRRLSME